MAVNYKFNSNALSDTNEKKILYNPGFRNSDYEERFFNEVMKKCGEWGNEEPKNVYNFFVNGPFNGKISSPVNNMVIIGDVSDSAVINARSMVVVGDDADNNDVMAVLEREAQRNWDNIDVCLSDEETQTKEYSRSILLLKTFSKCMRYMEGMDEEKFKTVCRDILECVVKNKA